MLEKSESEPQNQPKQPFWRGLLGGAAFGGLWGSSCVVLLSEGEVKRKNLLTYGGIGAGIGALILGPDLFKESSNTHLKESENKRMLEKGKEKAYQAVDLAADKASEKAKQPSMIGGALFGAFVTGGAVAYCTDHFINEPYKNFKPAKFAAVVGAALGAWSCSRFADRLIDKNLREPGKDMVDQVAGTVTNTAHTAKGKALEALEKKSMGLVKKSQVEQVLDTALEGDSGRGR